MNALYDHDFLLTWEHDVAPLRAVLDTAHALEDLARSGVSARVFDSGLGLSIFRDNSTRTRYAFRSGCNLLGLMTE
jgi:ornithine carbamoyltransferase